MLHLRIALVLLLLAARGAFAATPVLVKDIDPRTAREDFRGVHPNQFHSLGDRVVYVLHNQLDDDRADELWASDGTLSGTRRVFTANGDVHSITVLGTAGHAAIFVVSRHLTTFEARLFGSTDGTPEGTAELTGVALSGFPSGISRAGLFYFTIDDPATGSSSGARTARRRARCCCATSLPELMAATRAPSSPPPTVSGSSPTAPKAPDCGRRTARGRALGGRLCCRRTPLPWR